MTDRACACSDSQLVPELRHVFLGGAFVSEVTGGTRPCPRCSAEYDHTLGRSRCVAHYPRLRHLRASIIPEDAVLLRAFRVRSWEGFVCKGDTGYPFKEYERRHVHFAFTNAWGHREQEYVTIRHHARGVMTVRAVRAVERFARTAASK